MAIAVGIESGVGEGVADAGQSQGTIEVAGRRHQVAEAAVPEVEQVARRQTGFRHGCRSGSTGGRDPRAEVLIRTTGSGGEASHSRCRDPRPLAAIMQAVDSSLDEQLEVAGFTLRVVGGITQEDRVALGPSGILDRPDELREIRVLDVGDDQAEGLGGAPLERAGNPRRPVLELARGGEDACLRLGPGVAEAGQHPTDRRGRHARPLGDIRDGGGHRA